MYFTEVVLFISDYNAKVFLEHDRVLCWLCRSLCVVCACMCVMLRPVTITSHSKKSVVHGRSLSTKVMAMSSQGPVPPNHGVAQLIVID